MADVEVKGAHVFASELVAIGAKAGAQSYLITRHYGQMMETEVKRRASLPRTGPPGPRIQTGNYVRSINLRMTTRPTGVEASVGTNAPQARRLEYGFVGADSLGRVYNQPPYAHWGPAADVVGPQFLAAIAAMLP